MKGFIDKALNAAKNYNVWDYGYLKIALFSLGILFGSYFSQFFLKCINIVWVIFFISYIWIIYKTMFKYWIKK